jgi:hypothetical protein
VAVTVKLPRGTRSSLDALKAAGSLVPYRVYWLTDENRAVVATANNAYSPVENQQTTIVFVIDGGGAVIAANQTVDLPDLPKGCTVQSWTITSDLSTTAVVDILRATYANYPTFTSIAGTEKPSLSAAQKAQDLSLTTWTTALAAGDILQAKVSSNNNAKRITIALRVTWS